MVININLDIGPNLRALGVKLMATIQDFTTVLNDIKAGIDGLKQQIADLEAKVANGGLTADEEQQVLTQINDLKNQLNPTPAPEPTPNP
jgi:uncharacterized coiled-coil DUF342 family protein